jgi:hypothetical protein
LARVRWWTGGGIFLRLGVPVAVIGVRTKLSACFAYYLLQCEILSIQPRKCLSMSAPKLSSDDSIIDIITLGRISIYWQVLPSISRGSVKYTRSTIDLSRTYGSNHLTNVRRLVVSPSYPLITSITWFPVSGAEKKDLRFASKAPAIWYDAFEDRTKVIYVAAPCMSP